MSTIALFSALYGDYDAFPQVNEAVSIPAIMYTDRSESAHKGLGHGWNEINIVDHHILTFNGDPTITAPMLAHKYWKMFAGFDTYDITVWMDASMTIARPAEFEQLCREAIGGVDVALMAHPWRSTLYEEADFSAGLPRYASLSEQIKGQATFYSSIGIPADTGLYASGFYIRRNNDRVRKLMEDWWWECVTRTHQDQISLPAVLHLNPEVTHRVCLPWHDGPNSWTHLGFHLK